MLYKGQRLTELSGDELQEAEAYAMAAMGAAQTQYALNRAFIEEVGEEQTRRAEQAKRLN